MIWLALLKRFWPLIPIAAGFAVFLFLSHKLETVTEDRDHWRTTANQYQQSAAAWEASFRQSESLRQTEQGSAVEALNASEAACDARVSQARSSAIKIEHIVTKQPLECKPGETIPRTLADPDGLLSALGVR